MTSFFRVRYGIIGVALLALIVALGACEPDHYSDPNPSAHPHGDAHRNANTDACPHADANSNAYPGANGNPYTHTNSNADAGARNNTNDRSHD